MLLIEAFKNFNKFISYTFVGFHILVMLFFGLIDKYSHKLNEDSGVYSILFGSFSPWLLLLLFLYQVYLVVKICFSLKYNIFHFLFFIFYFLFFIFYFSFFIFNFILVYILMGIQYPSLIYQIFSLIFILFFLFVIIKDFKTFFIRYLAIFITAISDIGLKYIYTDSFIDIFTKNNIEYYKSNLYLIPLSFALVQLGVEMYSFYKKNRPKYIRYKRLLEYKNSKKKIV